MSKHEGHREEECHHCPEPVFEFLGMVKGRGFRADVPPYDIEEDQVDGA